MADKRQPRSGKDVPTGRPTPREALAKATAAAGPAVARAQAKAGPKVEQAAARAGSLLGTLRDRAKDTAKGFTDGYGPTGTRPDAAGSATDEPAERPPAPARPRPRPRPN